MLIESTIQRAGGTEVDMGGNRRYHFKPNAEGAHVAAVKHQGDLAKFLSIPEGYRLYVVDETPATVELGEVTAAAAAAGIDTDGWDGEQSAEFAKPEDDAEQKPETVDASNATEGNVLDRDYWVERYIEKFGKKPHHKANVDTIKAAVEAE